MFTDHQESIVISAGERGEAPHPFPLEIRQSWISGLTGIFLNIIK